MHLHDLHSDHQELLNHISNPCIPGKLENSPSLHLLLSPLRKVKKHPLLSVNKVLYLGIDDKYEHISSNNDLPSQFIAANFYGEICRRKISSYLITVRFHDMLLFSKP